ncbi:SUF system Fe-S cluster assembly regulator [Francisellaceae bacterium]|nr:SUF system Fe-S cluster assembly regulator [Francisellaceae bacterium]
MLRISKLADYAVNVVVHFTEYPKQIFSATEISARTSLQLPTVRKVMKLLAKEEILKATRGLNGGYAFNGNIDKLSLANVIEAVDGPIAILDCIDSKEYSCNAPNCNLKPKWKVVNIAIRETLNNILIKNLVTKTNNEIYVSLEGLVNV